MKSLLLSTIALFTISTLFAQDYSEALQFSESTPDGNARYMSMGGAMSALGANYGAVQSNPAGMAVFRQNSFEASLQGQFAYSSSSFLDNSTFALKPNLNISNIAWGGALKMPEGGALKYIGMGVSYNRNESFLSHRKYSGLNIKSSMTDDFLQRANYETDVEIANAGPELANDYEYLAYNTYIIDHYVEGEDKIWYYSDYSDHMGDLTRNFNQKQSYQVLETGRNSKTAFTAAANFSDMVFIGVGLNYSRLRFTKKLDYLEMDMASPEYLSDFTYDTETKFIGDGFSADVGVIVRPIFPLRIGVSYKSPTLYYMKEEHYAAMNSYFVNSPDSASHEFFSDFVSETDYYFTSPQKITAGVGVVLGKFASLGLDYELTDYSKSNYSTTNYHGDFNDLNEEIKNNLVAQHGVKVGGEFKLDKYWAVRAGVNGYTSPYKDDDDLLLKTVLATGIGYRGNGTYFDVAYQLTSKDKYDVIYNDWEREQVAGSAKDNLHKITVTLGWYY